MDQPRRKVHILMCTGDDEDLNLGLTSGFTYHLRDKYDLQIRDIPSASKFLEHAAREHVDVFIIILNNIIPDAWELFPTNLEARNTLPAIRVDQALQILSFLKQKYHKPVLALAAWWPENWDVSSKVKHHDLDYFSFLPTDGQSLVKALAKCLEGLEPVKQE